MRAGSGDAVTWSEDKREGSGDVIVRAVGDGQCNIASGSFVIAQVAGGGWERRAGVRDVIARAANDATRAGGGNAIAQVADNAAREGSGRWCQARTREGGRQGLQTAKEEVWGGGGE